MAVRTRERTSLENTKAIKCAVCRKDYTPECNFNQGRCPHHPPMLNIQPKDTSKGHFYVSLVKSIIRIGAGGCLIQGNLLFAGFLLIFAEVLGVVEELV
jgi:hypothetical protein